MKVFANLKELMVSNSRLGNELVGEVGKGDWQENEIYLYDDLEDFAEYELTEGWYASLDVKQDWNGAPNPLDYIDLQRLGESLSDSWDSSCYYLTENDSVLATSTGW